MKTLDSTYLLVAELHARHSKAIRKQVGACIVTKSGIIIPGYNGTPSGTDNQCENTVCDPEGNILLVTKANVIHAELNCILKAAKEGISVVGGTCYVTLAPCLQCSAMLVQAGIDKVIFKETYRTSEGIEFLQKSNIEIQQLGEQDAASFQAN